MALPVLALPGVLLAGTIALISWKAGGGTGWRRANVVILVAEVVLLGLG